MSTNPETPMLNVRETHQYLKESAFENLFTQVLGLGPSHSNPQHYSRRNRISTHRHRRKTRHGRL